MTGAGLTDAMRPTTLRPLLMTLLIALAHPVFGAPVEGDKPRPRRSPPVARPAEAVGLRPTLGVLPPAVIAVLPAPSQPGGAFTTAGLRSSLPALGDQGAQCRAACANRRFTCTAEDVAPDCAPRWAMCIARCSL